MTFEADDERATGESDQIARLVAPIIAAELSEIRERENSLRERIEREQATILQACREVGDALDALKQSRFTRAEKRASERLENAAQRLQEIVKERGHVFPAPEKPARQRKEPAQPRRVSIGPLSFSAQQQLRAFLPGPRSYKIGKSTIEALEKRGLIRSVPVPNDRLSRLYQITDAGRAALPSD